MKDETTQTTAEPAHLDAIYAAPEHHKVIFEDDRVRVTELRVKPGDVVPLHTHRWTSVNYVVKASDFLSYDADGNVTLDSRAAEPEIKEGAVFCQPPFPAPHAVENIGEVEMFGISVELKD